MKIMYVSYNGATEPLFQSQGMPYIMRASKSGYDFFLLTFELGKNTRKDDKVFLKMTDMFSKAGIFWSHLRFHRRPAFIAKTYDLLAGIFSSFVAVIKFRPDVIQARGIFSALIALPVSFAVRRPFIFDTRSNLSEAYAISGRWKRGGLASRLISMLERRCIKSSAAVIVETTDHRADVERFLSENNMKKPLEVIPCCVDLDRFKDAGKAERHGSEFVIAYLGSLSGWYCLKETISFFAEMRRVVPESKMIFLTKDDPEAILKYVRENALPGDSVKIFSLTPDMVPDRLAASTAGIVFKYPNQRLSSFPVKVGEYLASGIPVIINKGMGDVEDFILSNRVGAIIDGFDNVALRKGVAEVLSLAGERDIRERCLSAAEKLSARIGALKYMKIYEVINEGMRR